MKLSPTQQRIFDLVERWPDISAERLRELVWADDPNGGPGHKTIHVHIWHLNQKLKAEGIEVRAPFGAGAGYQIKPLPQMEVTS